MTTVKVDARSIAAEFLASLPSDQLDLGQRLDDLGDRETQVHLAVKQGQQFGTDWCDQSHPFDVEVRVAVVHSFAPSSVGPDRSVGGSSAQGSASSVEDNANGSAS